VGEHQYVSSLARSRAEHLVAAIYEAALRPSHWAVVLESIVAQFKGKAAALRTFEAMPETGGLWMTHGLGRKPLDEFTRYFQARNVWEARATARGASTPGTVVTSDMLLPYRELQASEFYRDFLRPHDLNDLLGLVLHDGLTPPMPRTVLSIFRGHRHARFGEADVNLAREYLPHLARSVEMNFRFAELRRLEAINRVTLTRFAPAFAYFRRDGAMLEANRAAEELFAGSDGLALVGGRLKAHAPRDDELLQRVLENGDSPPFRIGRPSGKSPYIAVPVSLRSDALDPPDARRPHLALFLHDPEVTAEPKLDVLARVYRLTPSETRMVQALVVYGSAKSIFRNTGLNRNTVRSQLNSVLRKTGTNAQAELMRLVLMSAVPKYESLGGGAQLAEQLAAST
jgi:DNA-binding CsgD family transcriptional regulator